MPAFFVYILECTDSRNQTSLYTGSTKDIAVRIEQHRTGKGARYTRGKKLRLVYYETHLTRSDAMKREIEIKKYTVKRKQELVAEFTRKTQEGSVKGNEKGGREGDRGNYDIRECRILIALAGLPGAGKSFLTSSLISELELLQLRVKSFDIDTIRNRLFGSDFDPQQEQTVRDTFYASIRNSLVPEMVVIADDLNYYASMRHQLFSICKDTKAVYVLIYVDTPLEQCLILNKKRPNPLDSDIITRIAEKFDVPGEKYRWDMPDYHWSPGSAPIGDIVKKIVKHIHEKMPMSRLSENHLPPGSEKKISRSHQIEMKSREIIHSLLERSTAPDDPVALLRFDELMSAKTGSDRSDPKYGQKLNKLRKKFNRWLELQIKIEPGEITLILFMDFLATNLN